MLQGGGWRAESRCVKAVGGGEGVAQQEAPVAPQVVAGERCSWSLTELLGGLVAGVIQVQPSTSAPGHGGSRARRSAARGAQHIAGSAASPPEGQHGLSQRYLPALPYVKAAGPLTTHSSRVFAERQLLHLPQRGVEAGQQGRGEQSVVGQTPHPDEPLQRLPWPCPMDASLTAPHAKCMHALPSGGRPLTWFAGPSAGAGHCRPRWA